MGDNYYGTVALRQSFWDGCSGIISLGCWETVAMGRSLWDSRFEIIAMRRLLWDDDT